MHNEQDKKFCQKEAEEDFPASQETYPSFYVDRGLESRNPIIRHALNDVMDSTRRAQELDRIDHLMHQISRGIIQEFREFEMSRMEKKAYHLLKIIKT